MARAMESCAASLLLLLVMLVASSPDCGNAAHHGGLGSLGEAVVVEREDVCVAGSLRVEARYCARLALRDVGTGEGFLNHQSWLRVDNAKLLLQVRTVLTIRSTSC
jgi:hypothetical protein